MQLYNYYIYQNGDLKLLHKKTEHDSCERPPTYISVFYIYSSTELAKDLTLLYSSVVALRKLVHDG